MTQSAKWPPGADHNPDLSRTYYAIIGAGFSALLDHVTLLANLGENRIGTLPVLHISDSDDPWKLYRPMGMGQWPTLLGLPGFRYRPKGRGELSYLSSREFAHTSVLQWRDLAGIRPFFSLEANVKSILENSSGNYEIHCDDPVKIIKAERVDVCGGPGPARRLDVTTLRDARLRSEYATGVGIVRPWPRVVTGEAFLRSSIVLPAAGTNVAIIGGGPTAAWCVERAESNGCSVVWISETPLNAAFVSSRRNDSLAQGPLVRSRINGFHTVAGDLFPSNPSTIFAEYVTVDDISPDPGNDLLTVTLRKSPKGTPRFANSSRSTSSTLPNTQIFDQVITALGQLQLSSESGSWAQILDPVLSKARTLGRHLIIDRAGRVIGLCSHNNKLRVLGAAALWHPDVIGEWRQPSTPSNLFFHSLVEQARVEIGITISAVAIAEANKYWDSGNPNSNLNTAFWGDFDSILPPVFSDTASAWQEMRAARIEPFTEAELKMILATVQDHY